MENVPVTGPSSPPTSTGGHTVSDNPTTDTSARMSSLIQCPVTVGCKCVKKMRRMTRTFFLQARMTNEDSVRVTSKERTDWTETNVAAGRKICWCVEVCGFECGSSIIPVKRVWLAELLWKRTAHH